MDTPATTTPAPAPETITVPTPNLVLPPAPEEKQLRTMKQILTSPDVVGRFAEVIGSNQAGGFVASVLLAVNSNDDLMACTPKSIIGSALRAATMRLSVDPGLGQAYLVPFKKACTLIVGYKGLYQMAMRTGKYRRIHVSKVFEGEVIEEDRMTGVHKMTGARTSWNIIGFMLYFSLISGFEKSFYMTVDEIDAHAIQYSKGYSDPRSPWKNNLEEMQRKTVLRLGLIRWGYFDPFDLMALNAGDEQPDATFPEIKIEPVAPPHTSQENLDALGYGDTPEKTEPVLDVYDPEPEFEGEQPAIQTPIKTAAPPKARARIDASKVKPLEKPVTAKVKTPISKEDLIAQAKARGVSAKGVDELIDRHGGDLNAVDNQLSLL